MPTVKPSNEFRFSGYQLDVDQRKLFDADHSEVKLSSRAFDTLIELIENRGQTLSKEHLMKAVWPNTVVEENNLNQAISSLRKALGDTNRERSFIKSVPGRGYRFVALLESENEPEDTSDPTSPQTSTTGDVAQSDLSPSAPPTQKKVPLPAVVASAFFFVIFLFGVAYFSLDLSSSPGVDVNTGVTLEDAPQPQPSANLIPNSIAVLPFAELNANSDDTLFSLGLHDELINQLSNISSINVISRESVVALTNKQIEIDELGNRLLVESVMSGSILFIEDNARVSLQLMEPKTGVTLWASTYEADTTSLTNMISIQSDIAINVAHALEAEINQIEQQAMVEVPTTSFEAYRYHLAAKNAYYQQDFEKTWHLAKQALDLDPNYLDALYTYSYVNTVLRGKPLPGYTSQQHLQIAIDSAEKSIEIAPDSSEGYALKASALSTSREWIKVAEEVDRLKRMDTPLDEMKFYGVVLLCLGDFQGSIEVLEANLLTEPVNLYGRGFLLSAYELSGNREKAIREYQIGEELNPEWWGDTVNFFLNLSRGQVISNIDEIPRISPELRQLILNMDDKTLVKQQLLKYREQEMKISAETVYYGALAARIDEHELAIEFFRNGLEEVSLNVHWLWLPLFDEARQLPSFKELLIDIGIVDYWEQYGWNEVCQPQGDSFECNWTAYTAE